MIANNPEVSASASQSLDDAFTDSVVDDLQLLHTRTALQPASFGASSSTDGYTIVLYVHCFPHAPYSQFQTRAKDPTSAES